jgi:hypothetical protein
VWEYKHVSGDPPDETELNAIGADGWELVGVVAVRDDVHLYFKRLVQ